jgi:hypothetical protein
LPKRLRCFLAERPEPVNSLTKVFLDEIERLLLAAAGATCDDDTPSAACPRLGAVSFVHRFGSALNRHVHLHACVTDGVFRQRADAPPVFLPARSITAADLAALTERVRRRVVRWFRLRGFLEAAAAPGMLAWVTSRSLGMICSASSFFSAWHGMPSFGFDTTRLSLWKWCRLRGAGHCDII